MGVTYTNDYVKERLLESGFKLVQLYTKAYDKHLCECLVGHHQVELVPAKIFSGRGCPICSGRKHFDVDYVNSKLQGCPVACTSVLPTNGKNRRGDFMCGEGHRFTSLISNILRRKSCPVCSGRVPKTKAGINKALSKMEMSLVGNNWKQQQKVEIRCLKCEGTFERKLANQLHKGYKCPLCTESYGATFDYEAPSKLYYARVDTECGQYYKLGVTNRSFFERFRKEERDHMTLLRELEFDTGQKAFDLEQYYLRLFHEHRYQGPPILKSGGSTELFYTDILGLDKSNQDTQPKAS